MDARGFLSAEDHRENHQIHEMNTLQERGPDKDDHQVQARWEIQRSPFAALSFVSFVFCPMSLRSARGSLLLLGLRLV